LIQLILIDSIQNITNKLKN